MNEIYIDVGIRESRVGVVEDGELVEMHIERQNEERLVGNIYKGKVENVLPGMQAAFVNIGLEKNGFLYAGDIAGYREGIHINDLVKIGDELLLQVSKEPTGGKGARLTTEISIPGKYVVLLPDTNYIGISKKIVDENERNRLRNMVSSIVPFNMGLIIRTEGEGKSIDDIIEDINFLVKLYESIKNKALKGAAPNLVHKDMDLVYRTIRDFVNRDTIKIVINEKEAYERALKLIKMFSSPYCRKLEYYEGSINIFDFYGIEVKLQKALSRKVWLKSGGYIIIDHTEALTSIDVNTGKYTGEYNLKDTILSTNMEAAKEIAKQLRLRDIGGIIVIDFIDMHDDEHKSMILNILKKELKKDRVKSRVLGITSLGLVEMTRKKEGKKLRDIMQKDCPICHGSGRILNEESVMKIVEKELDRLFRETDVDIVIVEVNDEVESYFKNYGSQYIENLKKNCSKQIVMKGLSSLDYSKVKVRPFTGSLKEILSPISIGDKVEINVLKSKYLCASNRNNLFEGVAQEIKYDENGDILSVTIGMKHRSHTLK